MNHAVLCVLAYDHGSYLAVNKRSHCQLANYLALHLSTGQVQQALDVQIVGCKNQFKEDLTI